MGSVRMLFMFASGSVAINIFFFFSSRRRHTRLQGDWSSDVCSSDLAVQRLEHGELARALLQDARDAEEVLRALRARQRGPAVREGVARRGDGGVDEIGRASCRERG